MNVLASVDVVIICAYFFISLGIAFYFSKRAGNSTEDFFLSGRKLPWWIAGTTMVATTFAADTPLAVTELVATKGIAGNWLWWNMAAGNMLTVFFFAKLWRRANILTDVEFISIRYSGKEASFLRGFRAIYLGVFMNCIIMGWVNVALAEILKRIFGISEAQTLFYIIAAMLLVGAYSAVSGLWGIAFTDMFQFVIAMGGCIVLAYYVLDLPEINGISGLLANKSLNENIFNFLPRITGDASTVAVGVLSLSGSAFFAHIVIQWWASWYPGAEPGGGGYVAQRMMSAKDEEHSLLATLWFTIAHYAVRPWPWIIVALASLVLFPELAADEKKAGFILAMKNYLPPGLLGLLVASFLAAYMSTISTQLNWGTSYLINDLYKPFIKKNQSEKHYILVSRIATICLVVVSSLLIKVITSISGAWVFIIECGAGLGLVLILRWFWWRINAWSEISAMIAPFIGYSIAHYGMKLEFPNTLFVTVTFTTVAWLVCTFVTQPVDDKVLTAFVKRTYPGGPGWRRFLSATASGVPAGSQEPLSALFINWVLGVIVVYSSLFSIGHIIFQNYTLGFGLLTLTVALFAVIYVRIRKPVKV